MPTEPLSALEEKIGTSRPTVVDLEVEAGKVTEFARAITDPNSVFLDEQTAYNRGHDRMPAPLTFTRVGRFPRYRSNDREWYGFDLGFEPAYVLHGGQAYAYDRPVRVGDVLSGTTTLTELYQREGGSAGTMTFAVFETVYTDQHDERVLTERVTSIETEDAIDSGTDSVDADGGSEPTPRPRPIRPREPSTTADTVSVGDTRRITVEHVDRRDFVRYAGASGDFNPIHYDEPYARAAGNDRVFGQGMFTAGIVSRIPTDWFGIDRIAEFDVRFRSRVFPGATIVATGKITTVEHGKATVELRATAGDETLLTGTATATLTD